MHDVVAWCFHSPRRLLAVVLAVVVLVIGAGVAWQSRSEGGTEAGAKPSAIGAPQDSRPAVEAAVAFARAWATNPPGQSADQWRTRLSGLVTPELAAGLAQTDPAALPGGTPEGEPAIRFFSVSSALVEVALSTGRHILVTVVYYTDGRWLASDVQPLAGNAGDVPDPSPAPPAAPGVSGG